MRRLPSNHSKRPRIEKELKKRKAGYRGEKSLDKELNSFSDQKYNILHDLRLLHSEDSFFQLDTLMVLQNYLLILEAKNIAGTIFFDQTFHQLIRTANGNEEAFPDPIIQIDRQQRQLELWLRKNKFPNIPIFSLIVIINPATQIKTDRKNCIIKQKVVHTALLPEKIKIYDDNCPNEKITLKEMKSLIRQLIKLHTSFNPDVLQQFQIQKSEILTGVHCPECLRLPMKRKRGGWLCSYCNSIS
ncbi:nuclease-related domain-containing protein [Bacillus sp. M6-12]|uniref:nuclease-related domain-containing protein n=1 Tax=Bacillus sp. M6-12 TaxID=2054166 RepID=UPI0015E0A827|nr:nuclease-related domain-containing protein [Bacillus sp. M6-12]